jgi:endonuclease/exonuclease/phosphatase (EEP) superfamily protein YafD
VTRILALYPAAVAILLVALPILAPRTGPLTLANIFSVHLALLGIVLVPVAIARRDVALRLSLALLVAVGLMRFGGDWFSWPQAPIEDVFRTASWNLELGARPGAGAVEGLGALDVDVIALQELSPDHAAAIDASATVTDRYPHRALYPEPGVFGMGILSRWPIVRVESSQDPSVVEAVLDLGERELTVINAHPLAGRIEMAGLVPVAFDTRGRDERLQRIRTRIENAIGRGESVIALGDFNVTPTEPGYQDLAAGLYDAHAEVGQGPGWTWRPSRFEWAGLGVIRIDHAFSSPRLPPVSVSEDCARAGDHCILEAAFSVAHASPVFEVTFEAFGDRAALPVAIEDRTGLLTAVEPTLLGDSMTPVRRHPDRPNTLVVSWVGGVCDERVQVAVVPVGPAVHVAVKSHPNCALLAGVERSLALEFQLPLDPSLMTVEVLS